MQSTSTETARRTPRQRPDLNIDTSTATSSSRARDAGPRTPPTRSRAPQSQPAKGSLKNMTPRSALTMPGGRGAGARGDMDMETFLRTTSPIDPSNKENDRPVRRDSHDLSLPKRQITRDSLMGNMLLSLDQFSMAQMTGSMSGPKAAVLEQQTYGMFGGEEPVRPATYNSRPRPGHGYSYSSDYEGADDSSRYSSQPSRGRRSNSSSGFQSSLGRINSMRETIPRNSRPGTPGFHTRGSKGSKSSSTSTLDTGGYAQVIGSQRFAHGIGGRSSSFDYGNARTATLSSQQQAPWHIEFSDSFFNGAASREDEYDAAPTPTVPGGPRRLTTVPSMPVLPPPEPKSPGKTPALERKRSSRSSKSAIVGRKHADSRGAANAPVLPPLELDSAPAPLVGYEKSKDPPLGTGANAASQSKDKPGFFRRMFGSSRNGNNVATTHPNGSAANSAGSTETVERPGSKPGQSSIKSPPRSRDSHSSATHTLQKKTSAFFRRKKSMNDEKAPPLPAAPVEPVPLVPPVRLAPERPGLQGAMDNPSPVTSLRRAMIPYLKDSPLVQQGATMQPRSPMRREFLPDDHDVEEQTAEPARSPERRARGFSPDYEPSPNAVIRTVSSDEPEPEREIPIRMDTPTRPPPEPPAIVRSSSFLHDNSDSEDNRLAAAAADRLSRVPERDSKVPDESQRQFIVAHPEPTRRSPSPPRRDRQELATAEPDVEDDKPSMLELPIEGARKDSFSASVTGYHSASSVPSVKIDDSEANSPRDPTSQDSGKTLDEPDFAAVVEPTEDDRQKAQRIFDGNEDFIQKEKAAAWMGEEGIVRQRTLRAYMDLYEFADKSILQCLRLVCGRLVFRAETQQVDRILVAFSTRWCECNPNHGFKAADVIHMICYSIMLLNTDLHLADIEHKMTRSQFVKNTMTTIMQCLEETAPETLNNRRSVLPENPELLAIGDAQKDADGERAHSFRNSFKPPPRNDTSTSIGRGTVEGCGPLVKAPFDGPLRAWETQVEVVLKDIYASIRDERLPLYGAEPQAPTLGGLNVIGVLKRTPSVLSKAPSEGVSSTRGRITEAARAGSRWTSKSRSRPRLPLAGGFASSRTSFDDGNSMWSPTESSATWSRQSLGRTQTSMSMDSFGSNWARREYHQSIGFANALSQAMIREDGLASPPLPSPSVASLDFRGAGAQLLDDESLELAGPPWIKEGLVTHKHHLDGADKKAKDRNWNRVFAVVQKGTLSLFSFTPNKSLRAKKSRTNIKNAPVGGGNWQANATSLGCFSLLQTMASSLPPPGYSRQRPHVWALSLPSGAVHLFQVGTPDICAEFVNAANYWAARLSTHPLVGGISNIEYGWSDTIVNNALVSAINESTGNVEARPGTGGTAAASRPGSAAANHATMPAIRTSLASRGSARSSSFDLPPGIGSPARPGSNASASFTGSLSRSGKLPGDRIHIAEWTAPSQPLRASTAPEAEQLETLEAYVKGIEDELTAHNALRSPMLLAFSPRGANVGRAMANWQRKSEYLLREVVKFRTYVEALRAAKERRVEVYAMRDGEGKDGEEVVKQNGQDGEAREVGEKMQIEKSTQEEAVAA